MVECATVYGKDDIRFTMKDGTEITARAVRNFAKNGRGLNIPCHSYFQMQTPCFSSGICSSLRVRVLRDLDLQTEHVCHVLHGGAAEAQVRITGLLFDPVEEILQDFLFV